MDASRTLPIALEGSVAFHIAAGFDQLSNSTLRLGGKHSQSLIIQSKAVHSRAELCAQHSEVVELSTSNLKAPITTWQTTLMSVYRRSLQQRTGRVQVLL